MLIARSFFVAYFGQMKGHDRAEFGGMVRFKMDRERLTEAEVQKHRGLLTQLAEQFAADEKSACEGEIPPQIKQLFDLALPGGRQIYESFSDAELVDILRAAAGRLDHSPAQKEIFWVYRSYLHKRFENWPRALRLAGLSRAAGRGGKTVEQTLAARQETQKLLDQVRKKTLELARTPHPADLPAVCAALRKQFSTWGEVLSAAGVEDLRSKTVYHIDDLEDDCQALLERIQAQSQVLGRAPQRREVDGAVRAALVERCGSWRNALYQIGLEPVVRISPFSTAYLAHPADTPKKLHRGTLYDCYYRVLNLDDTARGQLAQIRDLAAQLGRVPDKREIPPEVRRNLQATCGSWPNALFQIGLQPKRTGQSSNF